MILRLRWWIKLNLCFKIVDQDCTEDITSKRAQNIQTKSQHWAGLPVGYKVLDPVLREVFWLLVFD